MKQVLRNKDSGSAWIRYQKSFFHAIDGIIYAIRYEHNMIIIFICSVLVFILGMLLNLNLQEWLFCILIIGLIMATELINSAIEAVVDLASPQFHPLAKIAKDTASGATLIFCLISLIGGIIIFLPKIMNLLS